MNYSLVTMVVVLVAVGWTWASLEPVERFESPRDENPMASTLTCVHDFLVSLGRLYELANGLAPLVGAPAVTAVLDALQTTTVAPSTIQPLTEVVASAMAFVACPPHAPADRGEPTVAALEAAYAAWLAQRRVVLDSLPGLQTYFSTHGPLWRATQRELESLAMGTRRRKQRERRLTALTDLNYSLSATWRALLTLRHVDCATALARLPRPPRSACAEQCKAFYADPSPATLGLTA